MPSPLLPPPEAGNIPPRRRRQRGKRRKEKALRRRRRRSAFVRRIKLKELDGLGLRRDGGEPKSIDIPQIPLGPRAAAVTQAGRPPKVESWPDNGKGGGGGLRPRRFRPHCALRKGEPPATPLPATKPIERIGAAEADQPFLCLARAGRLSVFPSRMHGFTARNETFPQIASFPSSHVRALCGGRRVRQTDRPCAVLPSSSQIENGARPSRQSPPCCGLL